jgi:hypothetical protein
MILCINVIFHFYKYRITVKCIYFDFSSFLLRVADFENQNKAIYVW